LKYLPEGTFQPIDFMAYNAMIDKVYPQSEDRDSLITNDTFFAGVYLKKGEKDLMIKDNSMLGVNYLRFMSPNLKH
jgi:hypothetical protein